MKQITLIISALIFSIASFAQKKFRYTDKNFTYILTVDSTLTDDGVNYDCAASSISIWNKGGDTILVQRIEPPQNEFFCNTNKPAVFVLEDMNFDGMSDFRLLQLVPAGPNVPYYYWLYDSKTQQFQQDTSLEEIVAPHFDPVKKIITSSFRGDPDENNKRTFVKSTYKYINGKLKLISETEIPEDPKPPGKVPYMRK